MDRNDRLGLGRESLFQFLRIKVVRLRFDVHKDAAGADAGDRPCRGKERVGSRDDLVAGLDSEDHERDQERVAPGGDAHGVLAADVGGDFLLEFLNLGAQDEML